MLRYGAAVGSVAVVTAFIGQVLGRTHIANISILYLAAVLAAGAYLGRGPAVVAALASFMAFNWFFVDPIHTVTVSDPADLVTLLLFLATAVVTSQLAADQRARALEATQREREASVLYDVVRVMAELPLDVALAAVAERVRQELALEVVGIELLKRERPRIVAAPSGSAELLGGWLGTEHQVLSPGRSPSAAERAAPGRWVRVLPPGGRSSSNGSLRTIPLVAGEHRRGRLLLLAKGDPSFSTADDRLVSALATQLTSALEREELRSAVTEGEVVRRSDEAKSTLLHAVSHDLRTPLSSIIAGATSLRQRDVEWSEADREGFLSGIEDEARRLDRLVGDLLSVSRIESGTLRPQKELHDVGALVDDVIGRLRPLSGRHRITVELQDPLPPVELDYVEIDQVLTNLIENATKYAPQDSEVGVAVRLDDGAVRFDVTDRGSGVPIESARRIFEPFERVGGHGRVPGSGLGLALAKRFVEAHGGRIWVEPRAGGGSTFAFTIPLGLSS